MIPLLNNDLINPRGYNGNRNIKPIGLKIPWTKEMIQEYDKCAEDPIYFIRTYMKIVNLDRGLINFDMYDYQEKLVNTYMNENRVVVLSSRQSGKCQIATECINIRNKKSGEIISITLGELYEKRKKMQAL